jgi:hypothetical protein
MTRGEASMREVTDLMDRYRVVARSVWNTAFWPYPDRRNWDARDQFDQIKPLLFKALVVAPLEGGHCCDLSTLPERALRVVPLDPGPVPILIERPREGDHNHYWDDPVEKIKASDAKLEFLDYFDWDLMAPADFQYYRVRIAEFNGQSHLVGREALLEHSHARVFVEE